MQHRSFFPFVTIFTFLAFLFTSSQAKAEFQTPLKQVLLIDLTTGTVLYDKDSDVLVPPSSMSKIMTAYVVFNEIKKGRLSLKDKFHVSRKAWKMRGSRTFIRVNTDVTVEDLLKGLIIQSGNDAGVCLAEGVSGSEDSFVLLMTKLATEIGVKKSSFANATGMPDKDHMMTMRDIAVIATRSMMDFPDLYKIYNEPEFTYNKIRQLNRNPLLHTDGMGCDGLKTGHTDAGGYGLVASTVRDGRRLLLVLNGARSKKQRAQEARRLINHGYRSFTSATLFSAGETVKTADVWMGSKGQIPLLTKSTIALTIPRALIQDVKAEVVYKTPLESPVKVGDEVAKVVITIPGKDPREYPLVAGESVEKRGFFSRISQTIKYLVFGDSSLKPIPKDSK